MTDNWQDTKVAQAGLVRSREEYEQWVLAEEAADELAYQELTAARAARRAERDRRPRRDT